MTTVLATYNIKGGVGKTSAAANLASLAAAEGAPTLIWDLDPQGASTYLFRIKPKVKGGGGKLVRLKSDVDALVKGTDQEGLDLLPADFSYRHMDLALDTFKRPTRRLGLVLEPLRSEYEYIFLDCPPSISLVSESVFKAADALLVPIIPATLSSRTFERLEELLGGDGAGRGRGRGAPGARGGRPLILAFFSMVDGRKRLHREVIDELRTSWGDVLDTEIPASAEIERMGLRREVVVSYAARGRAAAAYRSLWAEVQERLGERGPVRS
ncbi:MAG TPA: AAA family ATPase [Solirubrobacteraceae bacterium]|jgi:cellulose biosynthesis protein BcsQ